MDQLILHHYSFSNYAEKVRLSLGYKRARWRSVIIPPVAPKPNLTPLTGGYRRTPVMQLGADIFCDTELILRELERLYPSPSYCSYEYDSVAHAIAYWVEHELFRPISLYVSGVNADVLPVDLQADRARMRGLPVPSPTTVAQAARRNAPAVRLGLQTAESLFADGRPFVAGEVITIADFALYHAVWFISARTERLAPELEPFARLKTWFQRMAAIGHGEFESMDAAEALQIARAHQPRNMGSSQAFPEDPPLGASVRVRANDYGRDPVVGTLSYIDTERLAVIRNDPQVGEVQVHFPRLGYDLRQVDS